MVSRLDYEASSIVAVEIAGKFDRPSIAVDGEGTVLLGNILTRRVIIIPSTVFGGDDVRKTVGPEDLSEIIVSYSTGVGDLGVTPDGRYILAALADGSEVVLVDRRRRWITSRYRLVPEGTSGIFTSSKSMEIAVGSPSGVNRTAPTVLYGSSSRIGSTERDYFYSFVLNEMYRSLDVVQVVKVNFGREFLAGGDFSKNEATDAIELGPAMIVASDDDQQYILLGASDSTLVRWFRRLGQVVSPLGDAVELHAPVMDLDVSGDGRLAVVLHRDRPAVTVLRGMGLAGLFTSGTSEERSCELLYAQLYLAMQGYPVGAVDGVSDAETVDALKAFQVSSGLKTTGVLDSATSGKLLETEITLARKLSQPTTPAIPPSEQAFRLSRLGFVLTDLWQRNHDEKDLDARVAAFRDALKELRRSPSEPQVEASYENNFCFALAEAGHYKNDLALLDKAIATCGFALAKLSADESPVSWANTQHSLGFGLWKRYEQTGNETTLAEATKAIRNAMNILERNDPDCNRDRVRRDLQSVEALFKK